MIDYLNVIIKSRTTTKMTHLNDEIQHIHPCGTRPPNTSMDIFDKLFQNDVCNLINVCN